MKENNELSDDKKTLVLRKCELEKVPVVLFYLKYLSCFSVLDDTQLELKSDGKENSLEYSLTKLAADSLYNLIENLRIENKFVREYCALEGLIEEIELKTSNKVRCYYRKRIEQKK